MPHAHLQQRVCEIAKRARVGDHAVAVRHLDLGGERERAGKLHLDRVYLAVPELLEVVEVARHAVGVCALAGGNAPPARAWSDRDLEQRGGAPNEIGAGAAIWQLRDVRQRRLGKHHVRGLREVGAGQGPEAERGGRKCCHGADVTR